VGCLAAGLALLWSGWAAASVSGSGWSVQRTPHLERPPESELLAVSCVSADACIAVGQSALPTLTLAERWDGHEWTIVPSPNPRNARGSELTGVSCATASACVAVGDFNNGSRDLAFAERWNGKKWTVMRTQDHTSLRNSELLSVSCSSSRSCVAVGDSYLGLHDNALTLAERWNGRKWTMQRSLSPDGHADLTGVSCPSRTACTAIGNSATKGTLAERWNGRRWTMQRIPDLRRQNESSALWAISCPSTRSCTAVGEGDLTYPGSSEDKETPLAERWNGHKWTIQRTGGLAGALQAISCTSTNACTASSSGTLAERWNGRRWTVQHTPTIPHSDGSGTLNGVSCPSKTGCTAVGYYIDNGRSGTDIRTLAERWRGR
jgi:hypothetical protein